MWSQREGDRHEGRPPRVSNNSEVVIMDDRPVATISDTVLPSGSNLNVTKSSRVHIGPKFVSVTQNVQNKEVVLGRILGLELESSKRARRIRCSVAVFVCWAFLVAIGLTVYLFYVSIPSNTTRIDIGHVGPQSKSTKKSRRIRCSVAVFVCWTFVVAVGVSIYLIFDNIPDTARLDIGLHEVWYLRRKEWRALQPLCNIDFLNLPLEIVIIGHSAANYCNTTIHCMEQMIVVQQDHLRRTLCDIGPNFLVGGNGDVFEGRGANVMAAMVSSYNRRSVMIMFLGNYELETPDQAQFDHVNILLSVLVKERVLVPNYNLFGHCQVKALTVSPGIQIMRRMYNFKNWNSSNTSGCVATDILPPNK